MLNTTVTLAEKYDYLADKFKVAYDFLKRTDLAELEPGTLNLEDGLIAHVQHYTTISPEQGLFETHDKYFDIQYVISGQELFGIVPRRDLIVETPYNPDNDITFYKEPETAGSVLLRAGDLAVVSPEDAHKPRVMAGSPTPVKKIVLKIIV